MHQNFLDVSSVHAHVGKSGGDSDLHWVVREKLLQLVECFFDDFADGCGFETKFHLVGVQLGHLGGFSNEPIQPVAFLVDDREEFLSLFFGLTRRMSSAAKKRRYRCLDGGEWSTKFMRNRIEQNRSQLPALSRSLGATEFLDCSSTLDGVRVAS